MKILIHDSLKAAGGINRRVREIERYYKNKNSDYNFIVLKFSEKEEEIQKGNFTYYTIKLPENIDHNFPYAQADSEEDLRNKFLSLITKIDTIIEREKPNISIIMGTFFFPWSILQSSKNHAIPILHLYIGSAVTEFYPEGCKLSKDYKLMEEEFLEYSSHTIFNSKTALEKVFSIFGKLPNSYSIVWNGVPESLFLGEPKNDRNGIGYIARYDQFKNPELIIKIYQELKRRNVTINFNLLSNLHEGIPIYQECINRGFSITPQTKDDNELREFYQSRICLIVPSKFETFGNIALESIASGIPSIISSGIGSSEVYMKLGLNDLIFDSKDLNEVCDKLIELQKTRPKIPEDLRKKLKELCSWNKVIDKYLYEARKIIK